MSMTNTSGIITSVGEECAEEDQRRIVRSLVDYNDRQARPEQFRDLSVLSRQGDELVGGLIGYTHWNWLFIKQLWVAEAVRRGGVGRGLMAAAEQEAIRRSCRHAHCDTFDFQALPFYRALGYHVFGELPDYPAGHTRFFLQKRDLYSRGSP